MTNDAAVHTPGPWNVGGSLISNGQQDIARVLRQPAVYGGTVHNTSDSSPDAPESGATCDANASLIAAAPDMLDALKLTVADLEHYCSSQPHRSLQQTHDLGPDRRLASVKAAIAKAERGLS